MAFVPVADFEPNRPHLQALKTFARDLERGAKAVSDFANHPLAEIKTTNWSPVWASKFVQAGDELGRAILNFRKQTQPHTAGKVPGDISNDLALLTQIDALQKEASGLESLQLLFGERWVGIETETSRTPFLTREPKSNVPLGSCFANR